MEKVKSKAEEVLTVHQFLLPDVEIVRDTYGEAYAAKRNGLILHWGEFRYATDWNHLMNAWLKVNQEFNRIIMNSKSGKDAREETQSFRDAFAICSCWNQIEECYNIVLYSIDFIKAYSESLTTPSTNR